MKIIATNSALHTNNDKQHKSPNFKSGGFLGMAANVMQGIENQGYLASFLIQDGLGMTAPRVWTGFNRDKEITGKWNVQEGFEVLGREDCDDYYINLYALWQPIVYTVVIEANTENGSTHAYFYDNTDENAENHQFITSNVNDIIDLSVQFDRDDYYEIKSMKPTPTDKKLLLVKIKIRKAKIHKFI